MAITICCGVDFLSQASARALPAGLLSVHESMYRLPKDGLNDDPSMRLQTTLASEAVHAFAMALDEAIATGADPTSAVAVAETMRRRAFNFTPAAADASGRSQFRFSDDGVLVQNISLANLDDGVWRGVASWDYSSKKLLPPTHDTAVVWPGGSVPRHHPSCGTGEGPTVLDGGRFGCAPCRPGTSSRPVQSDHHNGTEPADSRPSNGIKTAQCFECPPGLYTAQPGSTQCAECAKLGRRFYQDASGQQQCKRCPPNSHIPVQSEATSLGRCVCDAGYFVDRLNSILEPGDPEYQMFLHSGTAFRSWNCTPCPDNAVCNGTTGDDGSQGSRPWKPAPPYAQEGFWSLPEPQFRTVMFKCDSRACLGGAARADGAAECASTHDGRLCSRCADDHFRSFDKCKECRP